MAPGIGHIALIMDGNGRWAERRSRPRFWGHVRGAKAVSEIVEAADELGVTALTLYAFSTENWSRPLHEIKFLFRLLRKYLLNEGARIVANCIRFKVIGDISQLPLETRQLIKSLEETTRSLSGLKLNFAFGHGGRGDIVDAVNFYIAQNPGKPVGEDDIARRLSTNEVGDVDLLIRTGGEQRISNFLLWQNAYAELRFSSTLWPDFSRREFSHLIEQFQQTHRRFGGVNQRVVSFAAARNRAVQNKSLLLKKLQRASYD